MNKVAYGPFCISSQRLVEPTNYVSIVHTNKVSMHPLSATTSTAHQPNGSSSMPNISS